MRRITAVSFILLLFSLAAGAQHAALAFCALEQTLDFKTAKAGDKITLRLARDLELDGKILMARGTAVTATVVDARDGNVVSIVLDKATPKSGPEVPLMGIIAAVATPPRDLSDDPFFSMNHSQQIAQSRSSDTDASSGSGSSAAVESATLKGKPVPRSSLRENSTGAIDIDGLKLEWVLDKPPATTVLNARKKNFKLPRGTEVLLRMAPPKA